MSETPNALSSLISQMGDKGKNSAAPTEAQAAKPKEQDPESFVTWQPIEVEEDFDIRLADGSIRPMSQQAIRSMVIELKKAGMMDVRHGLELLDIPDSDEIAQAVEDELKLAALAKLQRK
jgi:hypothetical protein